jgi:CubicO group peptidase (beta-lactamase class C family)
MPIFLVLILLYASTLLPCSESFAQEHPNRPESIAELEREIVSILEEHGVPGAAVALVTRDERLWVGGIGASDVNENTPVTARTIFRWGSVSKSIVAVAVQMLAERELISLDSRMRDLALEMEFENPWESTNPVRLAHCLEHTTGFDDLHFNDCAANDPDITLTDALEINPNSRRSRWKPGTYRSYCNVGPAIAAHVAAAVSGTSFEEYVDSHVFGPLGPARLSATGWEAIPLLETVTSSTGMTVWLPALSHHMAIMSSSTGDTRYLSTRSRIGRCSGS